MALLNSGPPAESRLITALSAAEQERIRPFLEPVVLKPPEQLNGTGEVIRYVIFPTDAITSTLMQLPEGESVEVGLMGAEGMVGLALLYGQRIASTTVIVQIAGLGLRMKADTFVREVVEHQGELYRLLMRYANMFLAMVAQVAACNASHSVEQRLARWLLLVHDRVQRDTFLLTQEFLGLMLGVRRASVTAAASALRVAGALEYRTGRIHIADRRELEACACGCYAALRELTEAIFEPL